jgi:hypothetical protein
VHGVWFANVLTIKRIVLRTDALMQAGFLLRNVKLGIVVWLGS